MTHLLPQRKRSGSGASPILKENTKDVFSTDPKCSLVVERPANELAGGRPIRQVGDPDLVGVAKQGFGGLFGGGETVRSLFGQDMPDGNQQLAGNGDDGLLPGFGLVQALVLCSNRPGNTTPTKKRRLRSTAFRPGWPILTRIK